ncbi:MAG: hypothetical protein HN509_09835, partial [Halobacteriovoraceae bacterium]|nr:hypothetical protein [Halobacteriovoraceae bacterium]
METIKLILTKFTDLSILISLGALGVVTSILILYWLYYRKKFRELSHQIPASVVKNYLDSIIQNSSALKSSLFRGELPVEGGIPAVMPTAQLPQGDNVGATGPSQEELNQKNAEIAQLKAAASTKDQTIGDLEKKLAAAS